MYVWTLWQRGNHVRILKRGQKISLIYPPGTVEGLVALTDYLISYHWMTVPNILWKFNYWSLVILKFDCTQPIKKLWLGLDHLKSNLKNPIRLCLHQCIWFCVPWLRWSPRKVFQWNKKNTWKNNCRRTKEHMKQYA